MPLSPWRTTNSRARALPGVSAARAPASRARGSKRDLAPRAAEERSRKTAVCANLQWAFQLPAARTLRRAF